MLCERPYRQGLQEYPCYVCIPCRINRRRLWQARMMLESQVHEYSCFVTLTFDNEHLSEDRSLRPRDLQLWLKRLRRILHPVEVRYFAVGEYGDDSGRPHYHVALFGFRPHDHVEPALQRKLHKRCKCIICQSWTFGVVDVGDLNSDSAGYIAGYLMKYMTKEDDERLLGRHPEFTRMSLKPGIGADAMNEIIKFLHSEQGSKYVAENHALPKAIRFERGLYPIGRYLSDCILRGLGYPQFRVDSLYSRNIAEIEAKQVFGVRRQIRMYFDKVEVRESKRFNQSRRARSRTKINQSRRRNVNEAF